MKTEDSSVPAEARSPYRYHDHLIRFTAVGIELPQTDTVKIEMDGEWKDGKYGLQLQVDHWQEIVPPTLEGVRNYLASGLLKGIGEKTADAIIEKFGINALEILEHQPDRLLEIRGITKERLAEIKDAYAETSRMRVLMTLLAPFKVTPTTAQKIYQHFGPACADIVRQSPFNLCQVPGFGFKRSLIAHNARFINEGKTTLYYGEDFSFHKAESQEETAGIIRELYREQIAAQGIEQVEILSPFRSEGEASVNSLNEAIREEINPAAPETPEIVYAGKIFRLNDRVMQMRNNYDIKLYNRSGKQVGEGVFNGDIGTIRKISGTNVVIEFDGRYMDCPQVLLDDLELSYAITIHKSMGSEYDTVIIPLLAAHNVLLTRNLLYTAITRAKRRVLLVGEKRALYMAIHRSRKGKRNTMLGERIALYYKAVTRKALRNEEGEEWQRAS